MAKRQTFKEAWAETKDNFKNPDYEKERAMQQKFEKAGQKTTSLGLKLTLWITVPILALIILGPFALIIVPIVLLFMYANKKK